MISVAQCRMLGLQLAETLSFARDLDIYYANVCDDLYVANCLENDIISNIFTDLLIFTDSLMLIAVKQDMRAYDVNFTSSTLEVVDMIISAVRNRLIFHYGYTIHEVFGTNQRIKEVRESEHAHLVAANQFN